MLRWLSRAKTVLTLTPLGIELISGGFVPWADVAAVGISRASGTQLIGLQLSSHDAYIASLTPTEGILAGKGAAGVTAWTRSRSGGYDLCFSPLLFDRRAAEVVSVITGYWSSWLAQNVPQRIVDDA